MLQSNRVPETRTPRKHRRGQPKSPCRHRHFHRGLRPNRFDQRGDAQACRVLLAGPGVQAAAQELSRGLIHTGVAAMESLATWIDAKPYRFPLILLAHTAVVGAILAATARF